MLRNHAELIHFFHHKLQECFSFFLIENQCTSFEITREHIHNHLQKHIHNTLFPLFLPDMYNTITPEVFFITKTIYQSDLSKLTKTFITSSIVSKEVEIPATHQTIHDMACWVFNNRQCGLCITNDIGF